MQCAGFFIPMVEKIAHNPQAACKKLSNQYIEHCQGIYVVICKMFGSFVHVQ